MPWTQPLKCLGPVRSYERIDLGFLHLRKPRESLNSTPIGELLLLVRWTGLAVPRIELPGRKVLQGVCLFPGSVDLQSAPGIAGFPGEVLERDLFLVIPVLYLNRFFVPKNSNF